MNTFDLHDGSAINNLFCTNEKCRKEFSKPVLNFEAVSNSQ